jgi:hypothetical protein
MVSRTAILIVVELTLGIRALSINASRKGAMRIYTTMKSLMPLLKSLTITDKILLSILTPPK